jgi:FKBP-type peptidyl-prolyl cis-trans isomerase FkpA
MGIKYDQNLLVKGFIAALQGQSQFDNTEIQSITCKVESLVREKQDKLRAQMDDENKAKGSEFLRNDARRADIFITDSRLQY